MMMVIDPNSDVWQAIDRELCELEELDMKSLLSPALDDRHTQFVRGRLSLMRDIRRLVSDKPPSDSIEDRGIYV
ncbi:hypothetical protein [Aquaspirillum soli]